jgi:acyl carrier protein phosphodiesterase
MNYLAHLFLAGEDRDAIVGNLMGDFVKGQVDHGLVAGLREGILLHRKIDVYTDAHPVFRASRRRLRPEYRRYGGILIDIFYDHFLARGWGDYSSVSLRRFSRGVYRILAQRYQTLPAPMQHSVTHMIQHDLLMSYRDLNGIARALRGVEGRLKRESRLGEAVLDLALNYRSLKRDFGVFFPELEAFVRTRPHLDSALRSKL